MPLVFPEILSFLIKKSFASAVSEIDPAECIHVSKEPNAGALCSLAKALTIGLLEN